ncbi:site-specific integrase [Afipia massiliensis]|nr:site-specific integrase [Afipia massiliensis]
MTTISNDVIRERAKDYFKKRLSQSLEHVFLLPLDKTWDRLAGVGYLQDHEAELRARLAEQNFTPSIQSDALGLLDIANLTPAIKASEAFHYACNAITRAKIEDARILAAQFSGQYDKTLPLDPLFAGIVVTELPPLPGEKPIQLGHTLASAADVFFKFKSKNDWTAKTAADVKRVLALALARIGSERPINSVGIEDVKAVRDALGLLPPNYMKASSNKGISVQEAIDANISGVSLSIKTQDKYFTMFRQFLIWASNEGYIDKVPGAGVKVAGVSKLLAGEQRGPYSLDQLKQIFSSPIYTGHKSTVVRHKPGKLLIRDGKFWVPLIALYSGMRMGEIVQLLASDIKVESDIWYFDVSKGEGKSLKTISSKRRVPIHQLLIKMGFLKYVKSYASNQRLFPEIEKGKDGYHSHNLSKWWGRYSKQVKFKSPKTAFHSFRHNFLDALQQQGLPEYLNKALMGHADKSVHSQYSSGVKVSVLKEAIDKVSFDFDLSHLALEN